MDNFFSTYNLVEQLYNLGIYAAGTVRLNRFAKPPLLIDKQMAKLGRGTTFEIRSDVKNLFSIGLVKWYDNKAVTLGSNCITSGTIIDTVQRYDKKKRIYHCRKTGDRKIVQLKYGRSRQKRSVNKFL